MDREQAEYQHGFATHFRKIKSKISRADVADFMLHQLSSDTYYTPNSFKFNMDSL